MFRPMRRKKQQLTEEDSKRILMEGTSGVLCLSGDDDYPYAVPISYVYDGDRLYFHSAKCGHKIDAIHRHAKASFCVIAQDDIIPEAYTTHFRSVIVFGRLRIVKDDQEAYEAITRLALKYAPENSKDQRVKEIQKEWQALSMIEMSVEHISGKAAIELINKE